MRIAKAKTVLEAAVLDDILGVMILVVILGVVTTGEVRLFHILSLLLLAVLFFGVVFTAGDWLAARGLRIFRALDQRTYKLLYPVVLVLSMAWLANLVGLTAIIGAFAVGLILRKEQLTNPTDSGPTLKELLAPIELFLVPVFFVLIGMQVNLGALLEPGVPWLVVALVIAAVLGKLAVGYAVGPGLDRLVVGLGVNPIQKCPLLSKSEMSPLASQVMDD
jgi:Kef-type K+ transport system membrane component KefB